MKTITFKVDNDKDFKLLVKLAERLGISIENKENITQWFEIQNMKSEIPEESESID